MSKPIDDDDEPDVRRGAVPPRYGRAHKGKAPKRSSRRRVRKYLGRKLK